MYLKLSEKKNKNNYLISSQKSDIIFADGGKHADIIFVKLHPNICFWADKTQKI